MCKEDKCDGRVIAHGWCRRHYERARDRGLLPPRRTPTQRFWQKVDRNGPVPDYAPHLGPCWLWLSTLVRGYGTLHVGDGPTYAHRFSYEIHYGQIPAGAHLDHLCRVPRCVNPSHLQPVSVSENIKRSPIHNRAKTHCKWGHEFTAENTRIRPDDGARICRRCCVERSAGRRTER